MRYLGLLVVATSRCESSSAFWCTWRRGLSLVAMISSSLVVLAHAKSSLEGRQTSASSGGWVSVGVVD
jgi:hypothetical protein